MKCFLPRGLHRNAVGMGIAISLLSCLLASPATAANTKHHITLGLGFQKLLSDSLKDESLGIDFTSAGFGSLAYRISLKPNVDLTFDIRATTSTESVAGVDLTLTNSFVGPGVRIISPKEGVRPFVQANIFMVSESVDAELGGVTATTSENGAGFGIAAGVDIRVGKLLSIPIEANYMYGKPSDDVSGLGANVGLTFNFGQLE